MSFAFSHNFSQLGCFEDFEVVMNRHSADDVFHLRAVHNNGYRSMVPGHLACLDS